MISKELFPTELPEGVKACYFVEANLAMFSNGNKIRTLIIDIHGIKIREEFRVVHEENMSIDQINELADLLINNIEAVRNIVFSFR